MQRLKRAGGQNKVGGQRKSRDKKKWREAEEAHETHGKGCPKRGLKFNGFLRQDRTHSGDKAAQCPIVLPAHRVSPASSVPASAGTHSGSGLDRAGLCRGLQPDPELCKPFG